MKVSPLSDDPSRWTSDARGDRPEARAGERLRAAKALEPRELSAVYARRRLQRRTARWARRSLAWAAAWLLFGVTLTAGAVTVAVWTGAVRLAPGARARVEPREAHGPRVRSLGAEVGGEVPALPAVSAPPVESPTEATASAAAPATVVASRPAPRHARAALVQPSADPLPPSVEPAAQPTPTTEPSTFAPVLSPVASATATETAALESVVTALRRHADPRGALRLLDQATARFPRGHLQTEWATLRAEALLDLGDKKEALRVLDALPTEAAAFNRRLRVARGELRADQNRCAEAITDFQRVLSSEPRDDEDERALRGRAVCRANVGGLDAARSDLDLYVRLFPERPFAHQARSLLGKTEGSL